MVHGLLKIVGDQAGETMDISGFLMKIHQQLPNQLLFILLILKITMKKIINMMEQVISMLNIATMKTKVVIQAEDTWLMYLLLKKMKMLVQ